MINLITSIIQIGIKFVPEQVQDGTLCFSSLDFIDGPHRAKKIHPLFWLVFGKKVALELQFTIQVPIEEET